MIKTLKLLVVRKTKMNLIFSTVSTGSETFLHRGGGVILEIDFGCDI